MFAAYGDQWQLAERGRVSIVISGCALYLHRVTARLMIAAEIQNRAKLYR